MSELQRLPPVEARKLLALAAVAVKAQQRPVEPVAVIEAHGSLFVIRLGAYERSWLSARNCAFVMKVPSLSVLMKVSATSPSKAFES